MKFARIFGYAVALELLAISNSAFAQHAHAQIARKPHIHLPPASVHSHETAQAADLFPRVDMGFVSACAGFFPGRGHVFFAGYCPSIRWRIKENFGIAFEPAYARLDHDRARFGMFGLRPGVQVSLAKGRGILATSTAYVMGGMDLWIPTTNRPIAPSTFLGGHVGLGILLSYGRLGFGTEIRGLVCGGVGNQGSALAKELSTPRLGFEVRVLGLIVSFW